MNFQEIKNQIKNVLQGKHTAAVMVSGGLDSGLLLYTCMTVKKEENLNTEIAAITVPRFDDSAVHSRRIIDWVEQKFSAKISHRESGNPMAHHSLQTWSGVVENFGKFNLILMGCTKNPPNLPEGPARPKTVRKDVVQPFYNLTKKDTVRLAIELGLTDLMELSHTCTESKLLRCGECWQCRERAWGFAVNNYTDPGTM